MADETDLAQTEQVQGDEVAGGSPWESYLSRFPDETRDVAAEAFRELEGQTTRKFQEAASYKEQWQPYEQLGINQRDPNEVQWAINMLDAAQTNPAGVWAWAQEYAQTHGLTKAQTEELAEEAFVDPSITEMLEKQLEAKLGPIAQQLQDLGQWREGLTQEQQHAHIQSEIRSELDALKAKHSDFDEGLVDKLLAHHMDETDARVAVQKAFADAQAIVGQIEKRALQSKVDAGDRPAPEGGGSPAAAGDEIRTLKQAKEAAKAMWREQHRMNS